MIHDENGYPYAGKFIILAHARSGSTNLSNILEKHNDIKIAGEPFHPDYRKWHPDETSTFSGNGNTLQLHKALNSTFGDYAGIKTLMHHLTPDLNKQMIQIPGLKVIYLYRENLLQTAISIFISGQSKIWYKRIDEAKNPLTEIQFEPISIEKVSAELNRLKNWISFYSAVLSEKPAGELMTVTYEQLYYSDPETKRKIINNAFGFLGYDVPESRAIGMFLDPSLAKMNSAETYNHIPNAREIEAALGSDETGWLFK